MDVLTNISMTSRSNTSIRKNRYDSRHKKVSTFSKYSIIFLGTTLTLKQTTVTAEVSSPDAVAN